MYTMWPIRRPAKCRNTTCSCWVLRRGAQANCRTTGTAFWIGCGDSGSYPDTFCDAVGLIYDGLQQSGCTFVGAYAPEGYDETGSLVCRGGKFVGLAVDESAPDKTDRRVAAWCEQIKNE